jgi:hypothetical protein
VFTDRVTEREYNLGAAETVTDKGDLVDTSFGGDEIHVSDLVLSKVSNIKLPKISLVWLILRVCS